MIRSVRDKGLKRLHEDDDPRGVFAEHVMPGFRLHSLKGGFKGFWAVTVCASWRVIFRIVDPDAFDVDYVDYH